MKAKALLVAPVFLLGFGLVGCSQQTEQAAETAAQGAARDTERNLEQAGRTAEQAGEVAAENAGDATAAATITSQVKAALIADPQIGATDLNVDTKADMQQVIITGTVDNAEAKNHVTEVAQSVLEDNPGYKVVNNVTVTAAE